MRPGEEAGQALGGGVNEGLTRAKEPAFLSEASMLVSCRWFSGKCRCQPRLVITYEFHASLN